jgi:hypothetical protein
MSYELSFHVLTYPEQIATDHAVIAAVLKAGSSLEFAAQFLPLGSGFSDPLAETDRIPMNFQLWLPWTEDTECVDTYSGGPAGVRRIRYMYACEALKIPDSGEHSEFQRAALAYLRSLESDTPVIIWLG